MARRIAFALFVTCAGCVQPSPFDVDAGPEAFWASCGDVSVAGSIIVDSAADLDALAGVTSIEGSLQIVEVEGLEDLRALASLRCVGSWLFIDGNPELRDLSGLESLVAIGSRLSVAGNPVLEDLGALSGLRFVDPFGWGGDVSIEGNPVLQDLRGLDGIETVHGDLFVSSNAGLLDLTGLDRVAAVEGAVTISHNPSLSSTAGLARLTVVDEQVEVFENDALVEVTLPSLEAIDELHIGSTFDLGLSIRRNPSLERVAVPSLARAGELEIVDVPRLRVVDLRSLAALGTDAYGGGNGVIESPDILSVDLSQLSAVRGQLYIGGERFGRLELPRLRSVGRDMAIGDRSESARTAAPSVSGLDLSSLESVGGYLWIAHTDLADLETLGRLRSVGDGLTIAFNDSLRSLGLVSLSEAAALQVHNNAQLPTCDAEALEAQLRAAGFDGFVAIIANDDTGSCP